MSTTTKNVTSAVVDAWAAIGPETGIGDGVRPGVSIDFTDSVESSISIEVALTDTDAQEGVKVIVQVSGDNVNWVEYARYKGTAVTPVDTTLAATEPQGETDISLTSGVAFLVYGDKYFIVNSTVALSESVTNVGSATSNHIDISPGLQNEQASGSVIWGNVDDWTVDIPVEHNYARVIIVDTDTNAQVHSRTISNKTVLETT
jgi:hypothetical protein